MVSEAVRDGAREDLCDQRRAFANAFDEADHYGARAERSCHEERQERMNHFARDVHEKAHESERPYGAGNGGTGLCSGLFLIPDGRRFGDGFHGGKLRRSRRRDNAKMILKGAFSNTGVKNESKEPACSRWGFNQFHAVCRRPLRTPFRRRRCRMRSTSGTASCGGTRRTSSRQSASRHCRRH